MERINPPYCVWFNTQTRKALRKIMNVYAKALTQMVQTMPKLLHNSSLKDWARKEIKKYDF
ncbi:MAG: hypothetical protein WDA22_00140 [Bacteroidota bacterium]